MKKRIARHFNDWFDGFKTLKMIHYFTREVYPQNKYVFSSGENFEIVGYVELKFNAQEKVPPLMEQMNILHYLRKIT